jgi:hypothetical protein
MARLAGRDGPTSVWSGRSRSFAPKRKVRCRDVRRLAAARWNSAKQRRDGGVHVGSHHVSIPAGVHAEPAGASGLPEITLTHTPE